MYPDRLPFSGKNPDLDRLRKKTKKSADIQLVTIIRTDPGISENATAAVLYRSG
jgi:hypothetical protein